MKLRPIGDKVFIIPIAPEEKIGSIYLPPDARELPIKGHIVASGDKCIHDIPINSLVYYNPMSAVETTVEGTTLLVMQEENIMAYEKSVVVDSSDGSGEREMSPENPSLP